MVLKSKRTNKNFYKKGKRTLKCGGGLFGRIGRIGKMFKSKSKSGKSYKSKPPLPPQTPTKQIIHDTYTNRHQNPYNRLEGFIPNNQTNTVYNTFVRSKHNPSNTELGHLGQSSHTKYTEIHMSNPASRKLPEIPEIPEPIYAIPESKYDTSKKESIYDIVEFSKNRNAKSHKNLLNSIIRSKKNKNNINRNKQATYQSLTDLPPKTDKLYDVEFPSKTDTLYEDVFPSKPHPGPTPNPTPAPPLTPPQPHPQPSQKPSPQPSPTSSNIYENMSSTRRPTMKYNALFQEFKKNPSPTERHNIQYKQIKQLVEQKIISENDASDRFIALRDIKAKWTNKQQLQQPLKTQSNNRRIIEENTTTNEPLENYPERQALRTNANILLKNYKETEATMAQLRAESRLPESQSAIYKNVDGRDGNSTKPRLSNYNKIMNNLTIKQRQLKRAENQQAARISQLDGLEKSKRNNKTATERIALIKREKNNISTKIANLQEDISKHKKLLNYTSATQLPLTDKEKINLKKIPKPTRPTRPGITTTITKSNPVPPNIYEYHSNTSKSIFNKNGRDSPIFTQYQTKLQQKEQKTAQAQARLADTDYAQFGSRIEEAARKRAIALLQNNKEIAQA